MRGLPDPDLQGRCSAEICIPLSESSQFSPRIEQCVVAGGTPAHGGAGPVQKYSVILDKVPPRRH